MKIYQVDAFTREIFKGNPAGVCLFVNEESDVWLQNMAAEMNLSATAFVKKTATGFNLRWFTPKKEVDLCGRATLATAHILWETEVLAPEQSARFDTKIGLLTATKNGDWIQLDFPREEDAPTTPPEEQPPIKPLFEAAF
jgi:PhzF family phenazine biosynthesis protein